MTQIWTSNDMDMVASRGGKGRTVGLAREFVISMRRSLSLCVFLLFGSDFEFDIHGDKFWFAAISAKTGQDYRPEVFEQVNLIFLIVVPHPSLIRPF